MSGLSTTYLRGHLTNLRGHLSLFQLVSRLCLHVGKGLGRLLAELRGSRAARSRGLLRRWGQRRSWDQAAVKSGHT